MFLPNTPGHIENGQKRIAVPVNEFQQSTANGKELAFLYYPDESFNRRWVVIEHVELVEGKYQAFFPIREPTELPEDACVYLEFWVYMIYRKDFSI